MPILSESRAGTWRKHCRQHSQMGVQRHTDFSVHLGLGLKRRLKELDLQGFLETPKRLRSVVR